MYTFMNYDEQVLLTLPEHLRSLLPFSVCFVYKWFFTIVCLFVLFLLCDKVCQWFASGQWFSMQLTAMINWNIVESGVKHHTSNPFFFWILYFLSDLRLLIIPSVPSNLIYGFWLSPQYLQTWFTPSDYPLGTFKLDLRLI